ncbi:hypothetical protein BDK51DRAFT_41369 [Blyttiomyces helicus]|uniref:UBP-type domain-containing protein n=1 Tax=Blyttiomyces helicus TaxID=388810 RepID=A0A4P9WGH0_9FUNG|nr:hypothetical protein BDK51DRAFT_41369 [Blyttiomyces helicus]|eukprot:RKO89556.1 hypothetical protein BDK51DRAFT_41369 [Blyttiomyces helicus]
MQTRSKKAQKRSSKRKNSHSTATDLPATDPPAVVAHTAPPSDDYETADDQPAAPSPTPSPPVADDPADDEKLAKRLNAAKGGACPHLKLVSKGVKRLPNLLGKSLKPAACSTCKLASPEDPSDLCVCLFCGVVNCSRALAGHAVEHHGATKTHSVIMNIGSLEVWYGG